jgi:hypothetical protein
VTRFFRLFCERVETSINQESRINLWERATIYRKNGGRTRKHYFVLFDCDGFGQVARLVDVAAALFRDKVADNLQWHDGWNSR